MQDVIVTTVANYGWPEIMAFIVSVERSGFSGDKVMFMQNVTQDAQDRLRSKGWTLIEVVADPSQSYATARHIPVRDFLKDNIERYRYVLYVDVRDAVFQSDPSLWLENNLSPAEIIGPSECMLIKHQPTNSEWIRNTLGQEVLDWLGEYDVLCCGTIVGTIKAVSYVVEKMCEYAAKISGWGYDQAYFNYLLRIPPLKEVTREVNMSSGFIATCSWYLSCYEAVWKPWVNDVWPIFDKENAVVYTPGSDVVFPILHQYDRDVSLAEAIQRKYSE
jgi:hypothetical protein